ncbi:MAG: hypothetical protein ABJM62_00870, partial [Marinomonas sp.]
MITQILAPLLMMQAAPAETAPAQPAPQLNAQQRASLRCSAAFALVSYGQDQGNADALKWPTMQTRGREYFVRTSAQIMDEYELNRDQVGELVAQEALSLINKNELEAIMPACLTMLETS